jgi:LuxR family maltose regulon positive regulatory protein
MQGELQKANNLLQQAINTCLRPDNCPLAIVDVAYVYQADILRERNLLDKALEQVQQGIRFIEQTKYAQFIDIAYTILTRIYLSRGELDEARQTLQQIMQMATLENNPDRRGWLLAVEYVRVNVARGNLDLVAANKALISGPQPSSPLSNERKETARARFEIASGQYAQAVARIEPLLVNASESKRLDHVIEMRLLQAIAYQQQRQEQQALAALNEAVQLGQAGGYIRRFVDEGVIINNLLGKLRKQEQKEELISYLDKILHEFTLEKADDRSAEVYNERETVLADLPLISASSFETLLEPLSKREQEVLQLLAHGSSNQEIAQQLTLSINTVKRHTSNILAKLEAKNRTQAVNQARSLGLLAL